MTKKFLIFSVLVLLLVPLIWFANFYSPADIDVNTTQVPVHSDSPLPQYPTDSTPQRQTKNEKKPLSVDDKTPSYCKDQPRYFARFERDKINYLSQIAIAWHMQGESLFKIKHALEHTVSKDAADRFLQNVKLVSSYNEANQRKSVQFINDGIRFADYVKEKHRYRFEKWRKTNSKKPFIENYREQIARYPDIAVDILQTAFVQAVNRDNPKPNFDDLLLLYDSYFSLNPSPNKFILSAQLPYVLNGLTGEKALLALSRLLLIEQLHSSESQSLLLSRIGGLNTQFADIIKGASIANPTDIDSNALQLQIKQIIKQQQLSLKEQNVCQLYGVDAIQSDVKVTYVDAKDLPYPHPSCDRLLSVKAKEVGMLALFTELSAQFLALDIDLNNLFDADQIKRADLMQVYEYLEKKSPFERELAYLLLYSRPMQNKRLEIIDALVSQGLYPKNTNAVAVIQRLKNDEALKILARMENIDVPNQRGESIVYNLMFMNPTLTSELINRGFTQKHTEQSPDPLLKMLHYLRENRASEKWIAVITALINNGAKIESQHLNEVYRLQLTLPELYSQLIGRHPELKPSEPSELKIIQCHSSEKK